MTSATTSRVSPFSPSILVQCKSPIFILRTLIFAFSSVLLSRTHYFHRTSLYLFSSDIASKRMHSDFFFFAFFSFFLSNLFVRFYIIIECFFFLFYSLRKFYERQIIIGALTTSFKKIFIRPNAFREASLLRFFFLFENFNIMFE